MKYNTAILLNKDEIHQILERHFGAGDRVDAATSELLEMLLRAEKNRMQRNEQYQEMYDVAMAYYRLLGEIEKSTPAKIIELGRELDRLAAPFSDNVAYHAFLEMRRQVALQRAGVGGQP